MNTKYSCKKCKYSTYKKSSHDKHLSSSKHKRNTDCKYICIPCGFYTNHLPNYKHHVDTDKHNSNCNNDDTQDIVVYQQQDKMIINDTNKKNNKDAQIINLQQQLLTEKDKTINILSSQLKTKDKQIKTSNGLLKYLVKNHPNAPPLQQITNFTFIRDENECRSRMPELLIEYFNTDKFSQYLAENIVAIYKKAEPKDQSLWTSDVSRDNFIVKNKINENESAWIRDIKGNIMIEHAVRPCLNIILEELKWYFHELINGITHKGKLNPSVTTIDTMLRIKQAIDDKKIEEEIRKILSPKFCYPINAIEDVKT